MVNTMISFPMHHQSPFRPIGLLVLSAIVFGPLTGFAADPPESKVPPPAAAAAADSSATPPALPTLVNPHAPPIVPAADDVVENAVVKILADTRGPDFLHPWSKQSAREVGGSGVVIEGKRILTSAHVVLYANQIRVQASENGEKFSARVEFIAYGIDLAVLKLEDETFFEKHRPLPRAPTLPTVKDTVLAYGFPTGGSSVSITKGIVSRIEFSNYNEGVHGLRIQVDAAINPGNSGGPAVVNDKLIGLTFARLGGADNIGYIVPCEEIDTFLQDVSDGHYDGKPGIYDEFQSLENPALRDCLKLDKSITGVVVREPLYSRSDYPLKEWDVVTRIGDMPIDNEGMIRASNGLRLRFGYAAAQAAKNGQIPLTVLRSGKEIEVLLPPVTERPRLIPDLAGGYPPYFIYGPLVFSKASNQLLANLNANGRFYNLFSALRSPLITRRGDKPAFDHEELVIISSPLFPHKLAKGYSNPFSKVVSTVNGISVKNLNHLVEILRDATDEFIVVKFALTGAEALVLPRKEAVSATDEILTDNGIRTQGSPELLAVWNKTKNQ
jgi:S1-C subfamily serine protease